MHYVILNIETDVLMKNPPDNRWIQSAILCHGLKQKAALLVNYRVRWRMQLLLRVGNVPAARGPVLCRAGVQSCIFYVSKFV